MKGKIIAMIIIVLTAITGCQSTIINSPDTKASEYDKLIVKDISYDKSSRAISFKTENKSQDIMTTSFYYTIDKYEDNKWIKTNLTDDLVFIELALMINPNESIDEVIDLQYVKAFGNGYYRIEKQYFSDVVINQYIQFEVKDDEIINFESYNTINK